MKKSTDAPDGAHHSRRAFKDLLESLRDAADIYLGPNRRVVHPIDQVIPVSLTQRGDRAVPAVRRSRASRVRQT
jgi:hypothetical protein